jgi:hypothetical protein
MMNDKFERAAGHLTMTGKLFLPLPLTLQPET